jgi:hypothetical protein
VRKGRGREEGGGERREDTERSKRVREKLPVFPSLIVNEEERLLSTYKSQTVSSDKERVARKSRKTKK